MAEPGPEPEVVRLAREFREGLLKKDETLLSRMSARYGDLLERLRPRLEKMRKLAEDRYGSDVPVTKGEATRLYQALRLEAQVRAEVARWSKLAGADIKTAQEAAAILASDEARALVKAALPKGLTLPMLARIGTAWTELPREAIQELIGQTVPGTPVGTVLARAGTDAWRASRGVLIAGLAAGDQPTVVGRAMREALGQGAAKAQTVARTEHMRAYRTASQGAYDRNRGIVKRWRRIAAKDERTCLACLALDGREYETSDLGDFHVNCRCTLVPVTASYEELGLEIEAAPPSPHESAREWFARQPEWAQRAQMGGNIWEAWRTGRVGWPDLAAFTQNSAYGTQAVEATLAQVAAAAGLPKPKPSSPWKLGESLSPTALLERAAVPPAPAATLPPPAFAVPPVPAKPAPPPPPVPPPEPPTPPPPPPLPPMSPVLKALVKKHGITDAASLKAVLDTGIFGAGVSGALKKVFGLTAPTPVKAPGAPKPPKPPKAPAAPKAAPAPKPPKPPKAPPAPKPPKVIPGKPAPTLSDAELWKLHAPADRIRQALASPDELIRMALDGQLGPRDLTALITRWVGKPIGFGDQPAAVLERFAGLDWLTPVEALLRAMTGSNGIIGGAGAWLGRAEGETILRGWLAKAYPRVVDPAVAAAEKAAKALALRERSGLAAIGVKVEADQRALPFRMDLEGQMRVRSAAYEPVPGLETLTAAGAKRELQDAITERLLANHAALLDAAAASLPGSTTGGGHFVQKANANLEARVFLDAVARRPDAGATAEAVANYQADVAGYRRNFVRKLVRELVHTWAETSSDDHPLALTMQQVARDLFGLKRTAAVKGRPSSRSGAAEYDRIQTDKPGLGVARAFLQEMYAETQAYFARIGVTEVTVWRGMGAAAFQRLSGGAVRRGGMKVRPMTSFSTGLSTSVSFAKREGQRGILILAHVPVSRIIGTARSGYGCLGEDELVLLGGELDVAWVSSSNYSASWMRDLFRSWATEAGVPVTGTRLPPE